jgi:hypothetical protein
MLKLLVINYKKLGLTSEELDMGSEKVTDYVNNTIDTTGYTLSLENTDYIVFIEDELLLSYVDTIMSVDNTIDDWMEWYTKNSYTIFSSVATIIGYDPEDGDVTFFESLMGTCYLNRKKIKNKEY